MPTEQTTDVKQESSSSEAKQDVKATFDSTANAMIEALSKGSSPEEEKQEESDVLEKNTTEKEEKSSAVEEADATNDKEDKKEQEETTKEEEKTKEESEEEETTDEAKADDESTEAKHEESIPYSRFKEINEKAARFEGLAKDQESLITYCQQSNISPDQFRGTLEILALAQANPAEAIKRTEAFLEQLKVSSGNGLPADLAKEVDEAREEFDKGVISKERLSVIENRMKELAKARVQHTNLEQQNRFTLLQQQQNEAAQLTGALATWADNKRKLDPSFRPKKDATDKDGKFEDFLAKNVYLWTINPPKTPQAAVELAEKALGEVNAMVARYKPTPKAKKAPLSVGHSRSTESELPKSMDDVVNRVAKKHGYSA